MSHPLPGDKPAGYLGLIIGAVVLFVVLFGIVKMTNARYANEHGTKAAATATH